MYIITNNGQGKNQAWEVIFRDVSEKIMRGDGYRNDKIKGKVIESTNLPLNQKSNY